MSGRHTQRAAWRPGGLALVLTIAVGLLVWAAVAVALLVVPDAAPADVQGSLADADAGTALSDDGPPTAVPPQTLRLGPTSAVDATPSDRRAGPSRQVVLAAVEATAAAEAAEADPPGAGPSAGGDPGAEPVGGGGGPTGGPATGGGDPGTPTTSLPTSGPTDPGTSTTTSTTSTTTSEPTSTGSTHTPPGQTRTPTHGPHTP